MSLLFDIYQQHRIDEVGSAAQSARDETQRLQGEINELKRRMDGMVITCQALWEIIREHTEFTDQMVIDKIQEIDLRDGCQDGRIKAQAVVCSKCGRRTNGARRSCLYCGTPTPGEHLFDR
ncbi:MAG: hypothetical protein AB1813_20790 [Verrucomicrobiota bacterium]|jgi:hypothetical protein